MKNSNASNINSIRGMLLKEYLKKICDSKNCGGLRQQKVRIIYQHLITFMPGGNKKLYMLKQTCSWNLLLKYVLLFTLKDWHMFNCRLVAVVRTSRNKNFTVRMIFIFYLETIRRILKFSFSLFVVYFNLKLLFWYFF